jgi:uncharacterized protein YdeI (YjbR/CyaY-like superfamily)
MAARKPSLAAQATTATADVEMRAGLPIIAFASAEPFDDWVGAQAPGCSGLWLKLAKKGSGVVSVSRAQAVEVALCHGWIDGQLNPYNSNYWLIRFTPRLPRSKWSEINRQTVGRLMEAGRMLPAGLAQVEAAQRDGRWDAAYPPQSQAKVPPDFQAALDLNPAASDFFSRLTAANRFAVLFRIHDASTPAIREQRIAKFVAMLVRQEVFHPPKPKLDSQTALHLTPRGRKA